MKKTAIITGASTGIGKAIALELAGHYEKIAITSYHHPEELKNTRDLLEHLGVECIAMINNAGCSAVGLLSDMTVPEWERILNTNLSSVFYYCHEVVPHMVKQHTGRILNISSVWGEVGASCEVAYSATKGGVNAFTQALGKELAPSGIAVNAVSCGAVRTNMNACFTSEELADLETSIPFGRMAAPEEVAAFVVKILASPDYLTGQILRFDGGWI